MSTPARARRIVGALTAAALAGSAVVVVAPAARATAPAPGDWVVGNTDPHLPSGEELDSGSYDAVTAGPSGTLLAVSRMVTSPVAGVVTRASFGLLPPGPDVEPTWIDPLPG